jgi:predicted O-methyltransferase YrrM
MKPWLFEEFKTLLTKHNPKNIAEIGTHKGNTAVQIIKCLHNEHTPIHYTGYDVFDFAVRNLEFNRREVNGKGGVPLDYVQKKLDNLKSSLANFDFVLHKGFTTTTLEEKVFDFVYIDGGHSYETVKHDYEKVKGSKLIVFDDANKSNVPGVSKFLNELKDQEIKVSYLARWGYVEI